MDPRWEVDVGWPAQVGARGVVGAWRQQFGLFERRGKASAGADSADSVPDCVMASDDISRGHTKAGMGRVRVENSIATRTKVVLSMDRHPEACLEFRDEFWRIHSEA